jgi:hypothetical protein
MPTLEDDLNKLANQLRTLNCVILVVQLWCKNGVSFSSDSPSLLQTAE